MTQAFNIAVIPGDGIGKEVAPAGQHVLEQAGRRYGFTVDWQAYDWSCEYYLAHGRMMPDDGVEQLRRHDAVFFGAVGWPTVPDHISTWDLILRLRRELNLYVSLRPAKLMPGTRSPLADRKPGDIDFAIVRENSEGEYTPAGGRLFEGTEHEMAIQEAVFTRRGVDRIIRYAFEVARKRRKKLALATKSNAIKFAMPMWDERFAVIATEYPDVATTKHHIDILTALFVSHPDRFDVVVASNLFGDILSDLGPAVAGSIGIAPAANIDPTRANPSMFEPVHGTAPDIAGKGVANPIGQILAGAMMLDHLGLPEAAQAVERAVEKVLGEGGPRTRDLGGTASTRDVANAVAEAIA